jgi:hypothetical protein
MPPGEPTHDAGHHLGKPADPARAGEVSFVDTPLVLPRARARPTRRRSRDDDLDIEAPPQEGDGDGEDEDETDGAWRVHLARLVGWGFNAVRLAVVWEAIEHAGPGLYDEAYLAYVVRLLRELKAVGLRVCQCPHPLAACSARKGMIPLA